MARPCSRNCVAVEIGTKVVFISGYAEDAFEKNLEGQTDFAFLPKPFTLKQLAEAVKDAMSS